VKVSIIGGGGLVGSSAAFALQCGGVVSQIDLIDLNADAARGQALDLLHGAALAADQRIRATGYEAIPESDVVIITAGLRRKPDESRLDLINRNVELFLNILGQVIEAGLRRDAIVLVVSNPVDVLTFLATRQLDLGPTQVIGLGTQLDTARFRSLLAEALELPPTQVSALILGEHGDSMVPIWSASSAGGLPLERFPRWTKNLADSIFTRTRGSGAEVIKLKGGAGYAVGLSICEVVHAVALDQKRILPVSTLVNGPYNLCDVCISVPTVVGRKGAISQLEIELWPKELSALQHSAQVLKETIAVVKKSNPKAADQAKRSGATLPPSGKANVTTTGGPESPSRTTDDKRNEPRSTNERRSVRVTTGAGGGNGTAGKSRVTISGLAK
jgi:L-lactate dehydrogenase